MTEAPTDRSAGTARRITFAVLAMWLSRLAAIALGLVLMPLLFARLSKEELGAWLLLSQSGMLILLLDFGLTSTLTRRFAFLRGEEIASGPNGEAAEFWRSTYSRLAGTGRRLYLLIAVGVGVTVWIGGLAFIRSLDFAPTLANDAFVAWTIICLGQMLALSSGLWTAAISGLGHVAPVTMMAIGFSSLTILAQCVIVMAGGGLVPLAVAGAAGSLAFRVCAVAYLRWKEPALIATDGVWDRSVATELMGPSLRYFLTEVGALMLMRSDQYFISGFLDPESLPIYAANYILAFNAAVISIAIGDAGNVYVSQLWRSEARERVHAIVLRSMRVGMGLMALGAAILLFAGPSVTTLWLGEGHFVGAPVMTIFVVMLIFYTQQSLLFGFSRATEHEVYARWYLTAGAVNVALSFVLTPLYGLVGVAISTLVAIGATTGWWIPLSALRRLEIPAGRYVRHVVAPVLGLFGAACGAVWLATHGPLAAQSQAGLCLEAIAAGSVVGAAGFWILVLDEPMRTLALKALSRFARREIAPGE